ASSGRERLSLDQSIASNRGRVRAAALIVTGARLNKVDLMQTPSPSGIAALLRQPFVALRALLSLLASPAAKRRFPFA
ncbi:MAG: hypothetical protein V4793_07005, partial [Paraburkholderia tropica]